MEQRIEYERNLNHTYVVCKEIRQKKDYELQMLLNNEIPGLLNCKLEKIDGKADLYYEITSKQPLKRVYEKRRMNYTCLKSMFQKLYDTIQKMEEFLLSTDTIVMNPEMIYVDVEKNEFYFCVIPEDTIENNSLQKLLEFLLDIIDYEDEKAVAIAYEWYKKSGEENSSFMSIYRDTFELRNNSNTEMSNNDDAKKEKEYRSIQQVCEETQQDMSYVHMESMVQEQTIKKMGYENKVKILEKLSGKLKEKRVFLIIILAAVICSVSYILWKFNVVNITTIVVGMGVFLIVGGWVYYSKKQDDDLDTEEFDLDALLYDGDDEPIVTDEPFGQAGIQYERSQDESKHLNSQLSDIESMQSVQSKSQRKECISQEPVYGETVFFKNNKITETRKLEPLSEEFPEFILELFPFVLGKLRGAVDGVIEHETVSRIHCKIELEEGNYYITDLNSTNGTVVNEDILNTNERRKLEAGDQVRLGQAVYVFH